MHNVLDEHKSEMRNGAHTDKETIEKMIDKLKFDLNYLLNVLKKTTANDI